MATRIWKGNAAAVPQIDTVVVGGTIEADDLFILTCNGKALSVVAGSTVAATVAATIRTAFTNADISIYPEFSGISVGGSGANVVLTGEAGVPFTITASTTEANGSAADSQTFILTNTQAATGPNHWDNAANWSGSAVPVDNDDVILADSSRDILYGLAQSAVTLDSLRIEPTYTGNIGLPPFNSLGFAEYRPLYLSIGSDEVYINGGGSRVHLDNSSAQTAVVVDNTGNPPNQTTQALRWKGTHSDNVVTVNRGSVGIAAIAGDVAVVDVLTVGFFSNPTGDAVVRCGPGATVDTIIASGGNTELSSSLTLAQQTDGELAITGSAAVAMLKLFGGTVRWRSDGTLTAGNVGRALLDFNQDNRSRTVTNLDITYGAAVHDDASSVTWTNGIDARDCDPFKDCDLRLGKNKNVVATSI